MLCFCLLVRSLESISASADHQCITTTFWCSRIEREKKERKRESVRTEQASHDQMRRKGASEIRALSESEQRFTCCMMCSSSVSSSFSNRGHRPRISVRCCCNRCSVVSTHTQLSLSASSFSSRASCIRQWANNPRRCAFFCRPLRPSDIAQVVQSGSNLSQCVDCRLSPLCRL